MNRTRRVVQAGGWQTCRLALLASLVACCLCITEGSAAQAPRPNIVIILVDDMGFSDVGCYGGEIETPHIDRLAAKGLRFTQFYNAGRCCPTRASLLTGRHPHQVGIGHMTEPPKGPLGFEGPYQGHLNDNCVTLAEVLRKADYHTLMAGKWHVGLHRKSDWPLQRGFDRYFGCLSGACNYFSPGADRGITFGNDPVKTDSGFYATDTFTDYACRFVKEAVEKDDRPFFLYLAYNAPHWPLNSKLAEFEKYRGKYRDGWPALMKRRLARQKKMGLFPKGIVPAPHVGPKWDSLTEEKRGDLDSIMAAYAGCIDSIDQNIGKLTNCLKEVKQLDNTIIFFLSDNGACQEGGRLGQGSQQMVRNPPLETTAGVRLGLAWANACNTPFRLYKHFLHEGGACTPMIVSWPAGIKASREGTFVREFAYLPDFMSTCLQLSGAKYPDKVPPGEGVSILPLLAGKNGPVHVAPIYWEHEGNAAVRWGKWKLVREYKKAWELYDIETDRTEMRDLAKVNAGKLSELTKLWTKWAKQNKVAFPERFNMYEFLRKRDQERKK
jgi:arylsulfatase A-like enzyme